MSLIKAQGAGEVSTGFYSHLLDQSLKFNDDDSQYLTRTITSNGDRKKSTFSCWFKLSKLSGGTNVSQILYNQGDNSGANHFYILVYDDTIYINDYDYGSSGSPGTDLLLQTNRKFRDTSAWYNLVLRVDTTQSTAADRARLYINGVQETSFSSSTYPSQNSNLHIMNQTANSTSVNTSTVRIGNFTSNYSDGYMAEVNYCDGQSLGPDSFGETVQGIWTPKDTSGLTFGTNGFHLTFKDDVVSEGFNTVTYRGNNGSGTTGQSISGVGFKPAFIWIKNRDTTTNNVVFDYVRGNQLWLETSSTDADQDSGTYGVQSHDADGWTMGGGNDINRNGEGHAAWCWEGGGEPTATNSAGAGATPTAGSVKIDESNLGSALAGTIPATKISANTAKGFSVVGYTGTGSAGTIAHGLNSALEFIIVKNRDSTRDWLVFHTSLGATKRIYLNYNLAADSGSAASATWNDTAPTSSVFSVGTNIHSNESGDDFIAYCWHSVSGYSKFGSFTGNGGSQEITVGFRPALVAIKRTGSTSNWHVFDATRNATNNRSSALNWDRTAAEATNGTMTFSATGFNDNGWISGSGQEIIYMAWADTREAAFFKDVSSNGNHFTPVNLDYRDSVPDVPTNNFATFNALNLPAAAVLSEGNTKFTQTSNDRAAIGNMAMSSGKWYYEVYYTAGTNPEAGLARVKDSFANSGATGSSDKFLYITNATSFRTPAWTSTDATGVSAQTSETILGFAIDADNGKAFISVNGTYINSGDPAAGSNPQATFDADWVTQTGGGVVPFIGVYTGTSGDVRINFGQDSSFSGAKSTANSNADGEGHGSFQYAPPTDFLALCSQNLPDPDIIDGTEHFNTVTYTGDGTSSRDLEGFGFQPGFVWLKERGAVNNHILVNGGRGADKGIHSDSESTLEFTGVTSAFTSDGITLTNHGTVNNNSDTYVAWAWKATESFSNSSGSNGANVASSGLVNTTAGFSFSTFTADGSVKTIAHGMGKVPTTIWTKPNEDNWFYVYHVGTASDAETDYLALSRSNAVADYVMWNDTAPTSSLWTVGVASHNSGANEEHISFLFADVEGFSKSGSYVGNGNADGSFIYTGGRVQWIMIKNITDAGEDWEIWDSTRDPDNVVTQRLKANTNGADVSSTFMDFVANGVKLRNTSGGYNASGKTYVYIAFADQPFKFANAR